MKLNDTVVFVGSPSLGGAAGAAMGTWTDIGICIGIAEYGDTVVGAMPVVVPAFFAVAPLILIGLDPM